MVSLAPESREQLMQSIKCLKTELSDLRERFEVIVGWIQSEYNELTGLPEYVVIAVRGDRSQGWYEESTTANAEHIKIEYDNLDDSLHRDGTEAEIDALNDNDKMLKGIETGPVSRMRYQLQQRKLACREISSDDNGSQPAVPTIHTEHTDQLSFPLLFVGAGDLKWENDLIGNQPTNLNKSDGSLDENTSDKKQVKSFALNKRVKKTAKHLQANKDKGLILDAYEYTQMIATLPKGRLNCAVCDKKFATPTQLRRHEFEVHLTKEEQSKLKTRRTTIYDEVKNTEPVMCEICNKPFKNIESHKINHLPPEVMTTVEGSKHPHYRCLKCQSLFSDKKKYLKHITHDCKAEEIIENSNYAQHTEKLRKERNFLCNQCGQAFNRKHTLKIHVMAIHSKRKDFKCQYCDKAFTVEFVRNNHERKHLGTSNVTCELCGFTFTCKQILQNHIRGVHENRRPFPCRLCDKSFKTSHARDYHVNTHGNPNGRKRGLNREVDPIKAAAKRRQSTAWLKNRVQKLTDSVVADSQAVSKELNQ